MKIILAQGNPGLKYKHTRHNTGFLLIDAFAKQQSASWAEKKKFNSLVAELTLDGEKVLLVKPTTFYNDTGLAARQLVDFYSLDPANDFIVIHDDLALPLGTLRTRKQGSDAGNNGIKSLNNHIGAEYHRIRVGIWTELREKMGDLNFVIGTFTKQELETIMSLEEDVNQYLTNFVRGSLVHETKKRITD